ncbi:hypothetical protein HDV00_001411 [Rhizophlyctis rosea]|nr:hypothetical protein HDV00_001411 [Rhizophlyctis rosea]
MDIKGEKNTARQERKTVFKHTLDSPFIYKWPTLEPQDEQSILALTCQKLSQIGECRRKILAYRTAQRIQRKRERVEDSLVSPPEIESDQTDDSSSLRLPEGPKKKKRKSLAERAAARAAREETAGDGDGASKQSDSNAPDVSDLALRKDLLLGVNAVTRSLESGQAAGTPTVQMIFLFRGDVPVPHMYAHFPTMTYLAAPQCLLYAFGAKGAEKSVAQALGIKRVTCLGIKVISSHFTDLHTLLSSKITPPVIPWLPRPAAHQSQQSSNTTTAPTYVPTVIKTLQVPAPIRPPKSRNEEKAGQGERKEKKGKGQNPHQGQGQGKAKGGKGKSGGGKGSSEGQEPRTQPLG